MTDAPPEPTATTGPAPLTPETLLPAWQVTGTSALTEQDMMPSLDIMSSAVAELTEIGFGERLYEPSEALRTIGGRFFLSTHTLEVFTGLNKLTPRPVYAVYLYDHTAECFLIPVAVKPPDPAKPDEVIKVYPHSGDISELAEELGKPNTTVELWPLYLPAGLGTGSEMRLVATSTGIVPGAFYNGSILVGWFDFEKREWHITSMANSFLESNYATLNTPGILETNQQNWLDGTTVIPVDEIFEETAGKPKNFNLFEPGIAPGSRPILGVYGVLLGMQTLDNHLIAHLGFEDVTGTRYSLPFNLGMLSDPGCGTSFSSLVSNLGKLHTYNDQSTFYRCALLRLILANYNNHPLALSFHDVGWDALPADALDPRLEQTYRAQQEYAAALAQFIYSSATAPIGGETLGGRVNLAPGDVTVELVPAFFYSGIAAKY